MLTAVEYVKKPSVFDRSPWLKPIMMNVLDNNFSPAQIDELLHSIYNLQFSATSEKTEEEKKIVTNESTQNISVPKIDRILSIERIENVGLLNLNERIQLSPGLNVFYGKNGAGKSTIYKALCKVLGKNKEVFPSIYETKRDSLVEIKCLSDGTEQTLKWDPDIELPDLDVMLFDNQISNVLVEQDQVNEFNSAHLKSEYFYYLREVIESIEQKLQGLSQRESTIIDDLKKELENKVPFFFSGNLSKEQVVQHEFSKAEEQELQRLEQDLSLLKQDVSTESIKNISYAINDINKVLSYIGQTTHGADELKYTEQFLSSLNLRIEELNAAKTALNNQAANIELLPQGWVNSRLWNQFISASIDFVNSLDDIEKERYSSKICVYCHQPLQTELSIKLLGLYRQLREEHTSKIKNIEHSLEVEIRKIQEIIGNLNKEQGLEQRVNEEIEKIGLTMRCPDRNKLVSALNEIKHALVNCSNFEVEKNHNKIFEYWEDYRKIKNELLSRLGLLKKSAEEKMQKARELESKIQPIKLKKELFDNKSRILEYLDHVSIRNDINTKLQEITVIKRALSQLRTQFMNEEIMVKFEELLRAEYKSLDFEPPSVWKLKTVTRGEVNKRIYSLNDKRLSSIFSEGEKKIHALADFLAQAELRQFKGVYIFDDPVNSLDLEKMEYVAQRILRLVDEGNQVFVFTHNLLFLNYLISDTSKEKLNHVRRLPSQIHLETNISIDDISAMKKTYEEITKKMKILQGKTEDEISEFELREVYNLMSGYLEYYVEKKLLKDIISRYRPHIRMHNIVKLKDLRSDIIEELAKLYEQTSRKGSRHSHPIEAPKPTLSELINHYKILEANFKYQT